MNIYRLIIYIDVSERLLVSSLWSLFLLVIFRRSTGYVVTNCKVGRTTWETLYLLKLDMISRGPASWRTKHAFNDKTTRSSSVKDRCVWAALLHRPPHCRGLDQARASERNWFYKSRTCLGLTERPLAPLLCPIHTSRSVPHNRFCTR